MGNLVDWLVANEPSFRKTRLPSLYSDLIQQKAANPDGFAANVTAWESALTRAALAGQLPTEQRLILQTSDELLNALASPQYGLPSGLGAVFDDAIRNTKMLDLNDFKNAEHSIYQKSWIPSPWAVLRWGLRQTGLIGSGSYDNSGRLKQGQLVLKEALETVSKQIIASQAQKGQSLTDRLMTREAFAQKLAKIGDDSLSNSDIDVLLRYLSRDKQVLSYDSQTVKFKPPSADLPEPITKEDSTIASIKTLILGLERQATVLNERITSLQSSAQVAVKNKNKQAALSALKSKKLAENTLQQRSNTLHQLEEVYAKIEQAVDQVQVVEVMEASAGVLRNLNKRIGGVDRVDNIMDDLREQIGQVDEVGQVLQEPVGDRMIVDETEVDDEFEAMEKEEAKAQEEREAEATRQRLESLNRAEPSRQIPLTSEGGHNISEQNTEAQLQQSTEGLEKMHIDKGTIREHNETETPVRTAQEAL